MRLGPVPRESLYYWSDQSAESGEAEDLGDVADSKDPRDMLLWLQEQTNQAVKAAREVRP